MLHIKTGEFIRIERPVASSKSSESLRLEEKCKISYKLLQDEDFPLVEMVEGPGDNEGYLIIGSNNTSMVGIRSVSLFAYYEHYWQ